MRQVLLLSVFWCAISFALNANQTCSSDVAAETLIRDWALSGAHLRSAEEYELNLGSDSYRVPFLFPNASAVDSKELSDVQAGTSSVFWRSGRDLRLEDGMAAFSQGEEIISRFPVTPSKNLKDSLRTAFAEKFRMVNDGIARPIIQIVFPGSTEWDERQRRVFDDQPRQFGSLLAARIAPLAVIFWGSEFLPQGDQAAISMFDSVVTAQHDFLLRRHLFPGGGPNLGNESGSVYPTLQTVLTRRELRRN